MMKKKKKNTSLLRATALALKLVLREAPAAFIFTAGFSLLLGSIGGLTAPAYEYLFNAAGDVTSSAGQITLGVLLVVGMILLSDLLNKSASLLSLRSGQKIQLRVIRFLYNGTRKIPAISYENADFLRNLEKASQSVNTVGSLALRPVEILLNFGTYFSVMAVYLVGLDPLLVLALVFTFIPGLLTNLILPKIEERGGDAAREFYLKQETYRANARDPYDVRTFGAFAYFDKLYYDNRKKMYAINRKTEVKMQFIALAFDLTKILGWVGILLLLTRSLLAGRISAGAFAAVLSSVEILYERFASLLQKISGSHSLKPYVNNFFDFIHENAVSEKGETVAPDFTNDGIRVENVSFTYPGRDVPTIHDLNLTIRPGETVAIVGENGSGKTTLSKLLLGLYKPETGNVTVGGRNTKSTAQHALFSKTSAVFQNFVCYRAMTLGDNLRVADPTSDRDVRKALAQGLIDANDEKTFPHGTDTMMGREFGGTELSGGQWQRIAIARGLYREHEMIVLDEPTSAIDPLEESRLYRQFAELSEGKTSLLITHRLGSARIADRILVMEGGKIIGDGSHEELLVSGGKYAEMWAMQAANYQN